jgi:hypothetical protein
MKNYSLNVLVEVCAEAIRRGQIWLTGGAIAAEMG